MPSRAVGPQSLDRGVGDLVAGADADRDELAAADPAVRGLVVDAEPAAASLRFIDAGPVGADVVRPSSDASRAA